RRASARGSRLRRVHGQLAEPGRLPGRLVPSRGIPERGNPVLLHPPCARDGGEYYRRWREPDPETGNRDLPPGVLDRPDRAGRDASVDRDHVLHHQGEQPPPPGPPRPHPEGAHVTDLMRSEAPRRPLAGLLALAGLASD